jgi:mannose/fructose/N-acetylgalactosamine-specific phosphotransferase system component IIB
MRKALTERQAKAGKKEAYIGVVTDKVPEVLAAHLGLKTGLLIVQAQPDSPAAKAGLKTNDVLLQMNGKDVESPEQLKKLVTGEKPGATVKLLILRAGSKEGVSVTLGERETSPMANLFGAADLERFGRGGGGGGGADVFRWEGKFPEGAFEGKDMPGGARFFGRAGAGTGAGGKSGNTTTLNFSNTDGKITIEGIVTKDGKTTKFRESGTKEELLKKLDKFPENVRESIRQSLDSTESGPAGKARLRIESRADAGDKAPGKDGVKKSVTVRALDAKTMEELKAKGVNVFHGGDVKALKDMHVKVLDADAIKNLKNAEIRVLKATKELEALKGADLEKHKIVLEKLRSAEGLSNKLKDVEVLTLDKLKGLEDIDVKVRVITPEQIKDLTDLKDKLPKEIEIEVQKALKDAGLKDKLKEKVILKRSDSQ